MKVTNEIRSYVQKKVNALYEEKRNEAQAKIDQENEKIAATMDLVKAEVALALNERFGDSVEAKDITIDVSRRSYGGGFYYQSPKFKDLVNERESITTAAIEKTDDIIAELALGGTKADIDRLLEETKAELETKNA